MAHLARRLPSSAGRQWRQVQPSRGRGGRDQRVHQLLAEDIIEEVEVLAEEEQENVSSQERKVKSEKGRR